MFKALKILIIFSGLIIQLNPRILTEATIDCDDEKFLCSQSEECIFYSWRCDNITDCVLGEDESNCERSTCPFNYYRCIKTGQCIPLAWICEGGFKCPDEEADCHNFNCSQGKFQCNTGYCILSQQVCDGINDCDDGIDEIQYNCAKYCNKNNGRFFCPSDGKCIWSISRCDGEIDCSQEEDEKDCDIF